MIKCRNNLFLELEKIATIKSKLKSIGVSDLEIELMCEDSMGILVTYLRKMYNKKLMGSRRDKHLKLKSEIVSLMLDLSDDAKPPNRPKRPHYTKFNQHNGRWS